MQSVSALAAYAKQLMAWPWCPGSKVRITSINALRYISWTGKRVWQCPMSIGA